VLSQFQPCQKRARQTGGHGELFLRQTTAGSQSLELFAETLNSAHGTSKSMSLHISAKESPPPKHTLFKGLNHPAFRGRECEMLNVK
jgi:hypothetical protein